jgi:hypothetical protein
MKILLGNEELEIIEAASNTVVFSTAEDEEDEDDEAEEEGISPLNLSPLLYKVKLYKNSQAQAVDKTVRVQAANMTIQALSEVSAVLILINSAGQAVYSVPWDLVHSIESAPVSPQ